MLRITIFFLLLVLTLAQWGAVQNVPELRGKINSIAGFTEPAQDVHQVVVAVNGSAFHLRMTTQDLKYRIYNFTQPNVRFQSAKVAGTASGQGLFVVMVGKGETGATDLHFAESNDYGLRWKNTIQITNLGNLLDATMTYIDKSGRLFVFYTRTDVTNGQCAAFITRPTGSIVWSQERKIHCEGETQFQAVEILANAGMILVGYSVKDYIYLTTSNDLGVTWQPARLIGEGGHLRLHLVGTRVFAVYHAHPVALTMRVIRYSDTMGVSWSQRKVMEEVKFYSELSTDLCVGVNTDPLLIAFSANRAVDLVDTSDVTWTPLDSPFPLGSTTKGLVVCGDYNNFRRNVILYLVEDIQGHGLFYSRGTISH